MVGGLDGRRRHGPGRPLILGVWTVLGVTAAVIMRNALGVAAVAGGVLLASLTRGRQPRSGGAVDPRLLGFGLDAFRPHGYVIYHFWVDGFPKSVHSPGALTGLIGLMAVVALAAAASVAVFRRADIKA